MLIKGLCDYYDILAASGKVLPPGYSKVGIRYKVALTPDGKISGLIWYQQKQEISAGKAKDGTEKVKTINLPVQEVMPKRTEKTGIEANIIEHRPLYLFGLNSDGERLFADDKTGKARKSHEAFVSANLAFLEGLSSPVINAYRNFICTWKPEEETDNEVLLSLGKEYAVSGFVFCLSGEPDKLLHNDSQVREKWENEYKMQSAVEETRTGQCAITGETAPIARIHGKIKGLYGGLAVGNVLIGFKNPSGNSYGNEQSYNSNVSEAAMLKYTEALNYLLASDKHKILLDDMTVVFWAMEPNETAEEKILAMLTGKSDTKSAQTIENEIHALLARGKNGVLKSSELACLDNVDFYMVGLKPNSSRISLKFLARKKCAEVLWNIAQFQDDLQTSRQFIPVYLPRIKKELISPKSKNEVVNPALMSKIFEAMIKGMPMPEGLLETMIRRVKTDNGEEKLNYVRVGVIRACINRGNRKNGKEELKMSLDKENNSPAYLCGRLFAVLENVQIAAAGTSLNRTIKEAYFSAAATRPASVFPKLVNLGVYHINKIKRQEYGGKEKAKWLEETMWMLVGKLESRFPDVLNLREQGEFMVGYAQQLSVLNWKLSEKKEEE